MYPDTHAILIVDHDEARREAAATILRDEGFPVTVVAEGFAGLRAIGEDRFSLVIAALTLPGSLDGVATMRRARAKRPGLGFLLVADYPDMPIWPTHDADDVIAAPFHRWELLGCVFELLGRHMRGDAIDLVRRARTERWAS
ncbi:MAG TPA: response regulator [Stellaceae bacterium]|jgi:DNA-binding response OmpR family regulator